MKDKKHTYFMIPDLVLEQGRALISKIGVAIEKKIANEDVLKQSSCLSNPCNIPRNTRTCFNG